MMKTGLLAVAIIVAGINGHGKAPETVPLRLERTVVLCHPTMAQIKNIEEIYQKDILPLPVLKLICVYHESEETDYRPAREYVHAQEMDWVKFRVITGEVDVKDLFAENAWTPQFKEIFSASDGIVFTGGDDIPPGLYGQAQNLLTDAPMPIRSQYEISFLFHLLGSPRNAGWIPLLDSRPNYSVLAICLGCQSLNVATGGTLIQDIPSQVYHISTVEEVLKANPDSRHSDQYSLMLHPNVKKLSPQFHAIRLEKESIFCRRMDIPSSWRPRVLSAHHQSIDRLGQNLVVAARSLDGKVIEAVEHRLYPHVLDLQFHPEREDLYRKGIFFRPSASAEPTLNLRAFLAADGISLPFHLRIWKWFGESL